MKLSVFVLAGLSAAKKSNKKPEKTRYADGDLLIWPKAWEVCAEDGPAGYGGKVLNTYQSYDGRSGSVVTVNPYFDDIECQIQITTNCQEVAFRLVDFDIEYEDECRYDYLQVGSPDTLLTRPLCGLEPTDNDDQGWYYNNQDNYPVTELQWTPVGSPNLAIAFYTDGSVIERGWSLEYKCNEDLMDLPPCVSSDSMFGSVHYIFDADSRYRSSESESNLKEASVSEEDCPQLCFNTAGCSRFFFDGKCKYVIGNAARTGAAKEGITSSGALDNYCPDNSFTQQFTKTSRFYCKFLTADETDTFIGTLRSDNGIGSDNVLDEWVFGNTSEGGITRTTSSFVGISSGHPGGEEPEEGEAGLTWIKFEIKTHTRIGTGSRRRRSEDFDEMLSEAFAIDADTISSLQSTLQLPQSAELLETTETEEELAVISPGGEEAGSCSATGCECASGYVSQPDGSCAPPPPTLPPVIMGDSLTDPEEEECDHAGASSMLIGSGTFDCVTRERNNGKRTVHTCTVTCDHGRRPKGPKNAKCRTWLNKDQPSVWGTHNDKMIDCEFRA